MLVVSLVFLALGVVGALARPFGAPAWVVPLMVAGVELGIGIVAPGAAASSLRPLAPALAFLLAAVPLAVLLDALGFFEALASIVSRGRHLVGWLWVLAALVTTVLNLDASVVLLTPLYVRVARRTGLHPLTLAFQPVLLAMLASSALPVSNLTNLIAVGKDGATPIQFLVHLGPPSLIATIVGYWCYRRVLEPRAPQRSETTRPEVRPLVTGGLVVGAVLVGFVVGPAYGVAPWMVALGADAVLVCLQARPARRTGATTLVTTLGAVPVGTAVLAAALAVLAFSTSTHLPMAALLKGSGPGALARTIAVASLAANGANNLPALLVAVPALPTHVTPQLWAVLLGTNMGPVLLATGALATLLWLDTLRRMEVQVSAWDFSRVGLRVGLPALVLAAAVLVGLSPVLGP